MIQFSNVDVYNFKNAMRGMRNPLNSWHKNDTIECRDYISCMGCKYEEMYCCGAQQGFHVGEEDLKLATKLIKAGTEHSKFMRQIFVSVDIEAPLYWWKEFDTYKVGTVANSCSTMHKIHDKEFTMEDFSVEKLFDEAADFSESGEYKSLLETDEEFANFYYNQDSCDLDFKYHMELTIDMLNNARLMYLKTKNKKYWWQMIQLLPSSYNQKRTVTLNYEVIKSMYHQRKNHKLDEWSEGFVWFVKLLPYADELIVYV